MPGSKGRIENPYIKCKKKETSHNTRNKRAEMPEVDTQAF
jgi:hypothetical protein